MTGSGPDLATERLALTPLGAAHAEGLAAMNADPAVHAWLGGPISRAQSDDMIARSAARFRQDGCGWWALLRRGDGAFVGAAALMRPSFDAAFTPCIEVGWRLASAYWGHGYATEAAHALLAHGFGAMRLVEIVAFTARTNLRSRGVMARIGMHHDPTGDFDHPKLAVHHPLRPHVLYRAHPHQERQEISHERSDRRRTERSET